MKWPVTRLKTFSTSLTLLKCQNSHTHQTEKSSYQIILWVYLKPNYLQVIVFSFLLNERIFRNNKRRLSSSVFHPRDGKFTSLHKKKLFTKGWINVRVWWCVRLVYKSRSDNQQTCCFASLLIHTSNVMIPFPEQNQRHLSIILVKYVLFFRGQELIVNLYQ